MYKVVGASKGKETVRIGCFLFFFVSCPRALLSRSEPQPVVFRASCDARIYANAGHNPPLLCRKGDSRRHCAEEGRVSRLTRTGMALGVVPDVLFEQSTVQLNSGDCVLLYTDGVTDAADARGQAFGKERLRCLLYEQRHAPTEEMVAALCIILMALIFIISSVFLWILRK